MGENWFKWDTVHGPVDLTVVPEREYVRIQVLIFEVLLNIVAKFGDISVNVPLGSVTGLRMICCREHVLNPKNRADVLKYLRYQLLAIFRQEYV